MGRTRPLFDNVGHHPYGDFSLESPFARHPNTGSIGQGDYEKLVAAYAEAFRGTDQPTIGGGARIYYLEDGFETTVSSTKRSSTAASSARTVGRSRSTRRSSSTRCGSRTASRTSRRSSTSS